MDGRLLEACQAGDREAFRALFEAWQDRVYSLALHFSGDDATAQDIAQDVFLKLFSRIGQFRGDSSFGTWLFRLVANACMEEHRRRRRFALPWGADRTAQRVVRDGSVRSPVERRPQEDRIERRQVREAVQGAVAQLSPKLRLPILLRYLGEMSYDEIAETIGCTKGTVASRLNRGHRALARRLAALRGAAL
ncbi:MAG TPA: sigma-70 family RNA polymerase sigma factor [Candidatus Polarisedimenticolia bacterium]|nr:sigma-70 family RNA polymerase sigma factor [Candidatus Polarisedimenticolia bacterium]